MDQCREHNNDPNIGRRRRWAIAASVLAGLALVGVPASPALADQFDTSGTAPTVTSLTAGFSMQPASDGTSATFQIDATIGDSETLLDLTTVQLCLSLTSASNVDCTTTDPQSAARLVWTQASDTFAMTSGASTFWANATSVSNYVSTNTSMTMNFKFKVSEAARQGGWTARVTATDDGSLTGSATDTTYSVLYYAAVDVNRASQDFGTLAPNSSATAANVSNGTLQANGQSDLFYAVANFAGPVTAVNYRTVDTSPAAAPTAGSFAFDCSPGATFVEGSAVRIAATATEETSNVLATGTAEGGSSALASSCRLASGGGLPTGTYVGAVTITVASG